jgi:glycosyltransferase involved in cell wall biosynthesis
MKVLHIIPSISPLRGGPSAAVQSMVAALRAEGVDASILTTNDHGPGVDHSLPLGSWFELGGVPVLAFRRWNFPLSPVRDFAVSPDLNFWLALHLRDYQLLHFHALFSWPTTTAMAQARWASIPYVVRTIGQLNHWSLSQSAGRKQMLWRLIERRNLSQAVALHYTSSAEHDEASALSLPPVPWVLPLGVHLPVQPPSFGRFPDQPTTFLFLSRIHPKKQLECLLQALALMRRRRPLASWRLQIAGNGHPAYLAALQSQIVDLDLNDHCQWLGFLEGSAKWQALQSADWFVLPSASENFGIAAIEALAAGTPPILSPDVAVAAEIVAASAGYISSAEPHLLTQLLESALGGPPAEMRAAARSLAATRYSWSSIAKQLHQAYSSVLQ